MQQYAHTATEEIYSIHTDVEGCTIYTQTDASRIDNLPSDADGIYNLHIQMLNSL